MTIKVEMGVAPWRAWTEPLKWRDPVALVDFAESHREEILFEQFIQFLFFRQWRRVREYATRAGVAIIGDLPIYVAEDSVEVWQNSLFQLDETLTPTYVAGCPPDYFSDDGQLWGSNPWLERTQEQHYEWWIERVRQLRSTAKSESITSGGWSRTGQSLTGTKRRAAASGLTDRPMRFLTRSKRSSDLFR